MFLGDKVRNSDGNQEGRVRGLGIKVEGVGSSRWKIGRVDMEWDGNLLTKLLKSQEVRRILYIRGKLVNSHTARMWQSWNQIPGFCLECTTMSPVLNLLYQYTKLCLYYGIGNCGEPV